MFSGVVELGVIHIVMEVDVKFSSVNPHSHATVSISIPLVDQQK